MRSRSIRPFDYLYRHTRIARLRTVGLQPARSMQYILYEPRAVSDKCGPDSTVLSRLTA